MKHLKLFFMSILFLQLHSNIYAQHESQGKDVEAVESVIIKLFDGMREGDSAKVASVFGREINMYSSFVNKEGEKVIKKGDLSSFLKAIGTPHDQIWDEKIWNTKITIAGGIAQVWTDYAFYVGTTFSHCGVDAFHLVKEGSDGWKIVHLMDTRKKEGCELVNN